MSSNTSNQIGSGKFPGQFESRDLEAIQAALAAHLQENEVRGFEMNFKYVSHKKGGSKGSSSVEILNTRPRSIELRVILPLREGFTSSSIAVRVSTKKEHHFDLRNWFRVPGSPIQVPEVVTPPSGDQNPAPKKQGFDSLEDKIGDIHLLLWKHCQSAKVPELRLSTIGGILFKAQLIGSVPSFGTDEIKKLTLWLGRRYDIWVGRQLGLIASAKIALRKPAILLENRRPPGKGTLERRAKKITESSTVSGQIEVLRLRFEEIPQIIEISKRVILLEKEARSALTKGSESHQEASAFIRKLRNLIRTCEADLELLIPLFGE